MRCVFYRWEVERKYGDKRESGEGGARREKEEGWKLKRDGEGRES